MLEGGRWGDRITVAWEDGGCSSPLLIAECHPPFCAVFVTKLIHKICVPAHCFAGSLDRWFDYPVGLNFPRFSGWDSVSTAPDPTSVRTSIGYDRVPVHCLPSRSPSPPMEDNEKSPHDANMDVVRDVREMKVALHVHDWKVSRHHPCMPPEVMSNIGDDSQSLCRQIRVRRRLLAPEGVVPHPLQQREYRPEDAQNRPKLNHRWQ